MPIVIAAISAISTGIPATIIALAVWRRHAAVSAMVGETYATLGETNGQGTVIQMLEGAIRWQGQIDARFERMDARLERLENGQRPATN